MAALKFEIAIQTEDFSIEDEYELLRNYQRTQTGAICTFTGLVREFGDRNDVDMWIADDVVPVCRGI